MLTYFAEKLRESRQSIGLNQHDFAKAVGLTQSAISQFEKGLRIPKLATICKMSQILGVSLDFLEGEDELAEIRTEIMNNIKTLSRHSLILVEKYIDLVKKVEEIDKKN